MTVLIIFFTIICLISAQPSPPPGFGPPPRYCRPLTDCNLECPYFFRFGEDGCEICECRSSPCINETAILPDVECDWTANGPKCPSTHDCVVLRRHPPRPPPIDGSPPSRPPMRPPTLLPTVRGVCCIHVDFETLVTRPRP